MTPDVSVAIPGELLTLDRLSSVGLTRKSVPSGRLFILGSRAGIFPFIEPKASITKSVLSLDKASLDWLEKSGSGVGNSSFLKGVVGPWSAVEDTPRFLPVIWARAGRVVELVPAPVLLSRRPRF